MLTPYVVQNGILHVCQLPGKQATQRSTPLQWVGRSTQTHISLITTVVTSTILPLSQSFTHRNTHGGEYCHGLFLQLSTLPIFQHASAHIPCTCSTREHIFPCTYRPNRQIVFICNAHKQSHPTHTKSQLTPHKHDTHNILTHTQYSPSLVSTPPPPPKSSLWSSL